MTRMMKRVTSTRSAVWTWAIWKTWMRLIALLTRWPLLQLQIILILNPNFKRVSMIMRKRNTATMMRRRRRASKSL